MHQNPKTLIGSSEDDGDGDGDGMWVSSASVVVGKVPTVLRGVCEDDGVCVHGVAERWRHAYLLPLALVL